MIVLTLSVIYEEKVRAERGYYSSVHPLFLTTYIVIGIALGIIVSFLTPPYLKKSESSLFSRITLTAQKERNWMRLALVQVNKRLKECQKELINFKASDWGKADRQNEKNGIINQKESLLDLQTYFEKALFPFQSEVINVYSDNSSLKQKLIG